MEREQMNAEIESIIDDLWELHDEAKSVGDIESADGYAAHAFQLLEKLPGNVVYLTTQH